MEMVKPRFKVDEPVYCIHNREKAMEKVYITHIERIIETKFIDGNRVVSIYYIYSCEDVAENGRVGRLLAEEMFMERYEK